MHSPDFRGKCGKRISKAIPMLNFRRPVMPALLSLFLAILAFAPGRSVAPLLALAGALVMLVSLNRFPRLFFRFAWPLLGIFILGLLSAPGHSTVNVLRDLVFALNPILLLFVGFWLGRRTRLGCHVYDTIISAGVISAVFHVSKFVFSPELLRLSIQDVRGDVWAGDTVVTVALVFLLFSGKLEDVTIGRRIAARLPYAFVLTLSIILSYSRAQLIVLLLLCASLWLGFSEGRDKIKLLIGASFLALITFSLAQSNEAQPFIEKFTRSLSEVKVENYGANEDITANWRGFESFKAMEAFKNSDLTSQVFGGGFGALVDLGWYMPLGDSELRFLPILHNGYAYILVKFGIVGLLLYILFFLKILLFSFRHRSSTSRYVKVRSYLLFGCIASLASMMAVVGGMVQTGGVAQSSAPCLIVLVGFMIQQISSGKRLLLDQKVNTGMLFDSRNLPYCGFDKKKYFGM
jgi:O-antigen ligase